MVVTHDSYVAAGKGSAAETQSRRLPRSNRWLHVVHPSMSRYDVDAQNATVTRSRSKVSSMRSGSNGPERTVEAPNRKGKTRSPPVPNVKASVGWPPKRSSSVGRRTYRA